MIVLPSFDIIDFICFYTEDNSNAPERMASVQGTPEQVQQVQKMIQEIVEQVTKQINFYLTCMAACLKVKKLNITVLYL